MLLPPSLAGECREIPQLCGGPLFIVLGQLRRLPQLFNAWASRTVLLERGSTANLVGSYANPAGLMF